MVTIKTSLSMVSVCQYVCLLAYNSGTGPRGDCLQIFRVPQGWFYTPKFEEGIMGNGQNIGIFRFLRDDMQIGHCDSYWTGYRRIHMCSGQCADATETGVGADGPARILHTGTESVSLERSKSEMT